MNINYSLIINSNYYSRKSSLSLPTCSNKTVAIALLAIASFVSIASIAIMCMKNYRIKKIDYQEILTSSAPESNLNEEFLPTEAIVEDINFNNKTLSEAEWKSINLAKNSSELNVQLLKYHDHLKFLAPKTVAENLKKIPTDHYFMLTDDQINAIDFSTLSGEQYLEIEKVIINKQQSINSSKFFQLDFTNFSSENIKFIQSKELLSLIPPQTIATHFEKFEHVLCCLTQNQIDALDMNQLSLDTIIELKHKISDKQWQSLDLNSYTSEEISKLLKQLGGSSTKLSGKTIRRCSPPSFVGR